MRWRMFGVTLATVGALLLLTLLNVLPAQGAPTNGPQLAPSPRPPIRPTSRPERDETDGPGNVIGRITGTIIESSTGAPSPAIRVNVGGEIVLSDVNGNYERYVPAGVYTVTLTLEAGQGQPDQPTQAVQVVADQVTIQHLYYTRANAAPAPQPTAVPAPPAPQPTPPPAPQPTAAPAAPAPPPPEPAGGTQPVTLPVTGATDSATGVWLALGCALIVVGGLLAARPRRQR